jgi:hypothetical protein
MGQQQLLLIILGVIIVGIAVAVGITMFSDNSVSSNRDAMSTDMMHLAAKARHYYMRPTSMGGGGHSFVGLTADDVGMLKLATTNFTDNQNGIYSIIVAGNQDSVVFRAVGKTTLPNGVDHPTWEMGVTPNGQDLRSVK